MTEREDGRVFDTGDIVGDLECVSVSYQENEDNERYNFTYSFKLKSECDDARRAERQHQAALKKAKQEEQDRLKAEAAEEAAHRNEE